MFSAMISVLAKMFGSGGPEAFRTAHGHCWLVWEPGTWKPPQRAATVQIPAPAFSVAPVPDRAAEALVFALSPKQPQAEISFGRGEGNDIVVNDATLSARHLVFIQDATGWKVRDAGSTNGSAVDNAPLQAGTTLRLRSGSSLRAGQVKLTFLEPSGMFTRLVQIAHGG